MAHTAKKAKDRQRRHGRVRKKVQGTADRPRLAVFRSNRHISVQVIDDRAGVVGGRRAHAGLLSSAPPADGRSACATRRS